MNGNHYGFFLKSIPKALRNMETQGLYLRHALRMLTKDLCTCVFILKGRGIDGSTFLCTQLTTVRILSTMVRNDDERTFLKTGWKPLTYQKNPILPTIIFQNVLIWTVPQIGHPPDTYLRECSTRFRIPCYYFPKPISFFKPKSNELWRIPLCSIRIWIHWSLSILCNLDLAS